MLYTYTLIRVVSFTVYGKTFEGENFYGFCGFFAMPRKFSRVCFAVSIYTHYYLILLG